jgi:hypothetical protein
MSRFTKAFLYTVYFACVVGLCVAIATSFRSSKVVVPVSPSSESAHQTASQAAKPTTKVATPSVAAQASSGSTSQLSDTGPGNEYGLFVVASLGAALAYRRFTIHRLSRHSAGQKAASPAVQTKPLSKTTKS